MERRIANQRKKSIMFCIVCIMLFLFGVTAGISYAYFSNSKEVSSVLNFGKLIISTQGEKTTTVTLEPNQGNGITENGVYKIAANDTVSIAGTIGLEENSVPAYIRIKVDMVDQNSNKIKGAFKTGFMTQMAEMIDTTNSNNKQWFVVGNYLYLGNEINADSSFVFSESNTNTSGATAEKNKIKMTNEMLTNEIAGNQITVKFTIQAIQSAGMGLTLSNYTQANATSISQLAVWQEIFGVDLNAIYSNEYATNYVRGTLNDTDYKDAQVASQMTKSPYNYFTKSSDNTGDYVAFGFYPQTIKDAKVSIDENNKETFNGVEYYLGSDGYLYFKQEANPYIESGKSVTAMRFSNSANEKDVIGNGTAYYFKLEPIIWEVKKTDNKTMLVSVSELIGMRYYEDLATRTISGNTINSNNYEYSYIRSYLNGLTKYGPNENGASKTSEEYLDKGLLRIAFTGEQQRLINKTTIDGSTTMTEDKLFLLSQNEQESLYSTRVDRIKYPTDYAGATGAIRLGSKSEGGNWWSRSAFSSNSFWSVNYDGAMYSSTPTSSSVGVVPALFLNIQ